ILRWIARHVFKLEPDLALLVAAGSAICGAAAILAVAAMTRAKDQHAGIAIALITLSGTLALLLYPIAFLAGWLPGLDERVYGVFVGASIYELAQVYGASFAISEGALNTATLVKLSKVLMLLPLLLVLALMRRREDAAAKLPATPWPWFIGGFILVMLINSSLTLHPQARRLILELDQFLFVMVMVALGMTTRLTALFGDGRASVGWRLLGVGAVGLVLSSGVAYGLVSTLSTRAASAMASSAEARMLADPGGRVFASTGCAKCHVPALAGREGEVVLYSDLLLHDMGPALDDKIEQGEAAGADWRTTPLAGIRLRERYLHDGRATNLRDAILAHGGEGEIVRDRFFALSADDQAVALAFMSKL
ncbi:MAG: putative sulfate exporter family transporter, partial [Usitatibacteraceae bacterium]